MKDETQVAARKLMEKALKENRAFILLADEGDRMRTICHAPLFFQMAAVDCLMSELKKRADKHRIGRTSKATPGISGIPSVSATDFNGLLDHINDKGVN